MPLTVPTAVTRSTRNGIIAPTAARVKKAMIQIKLMNGRNVEVSKEELNEFITQVLAPNPYWRYTGMLNEEIVERYFKGEIPAAELAAIARYFLVFIENLTFTGYLLDKSESGPGNTKEFNMPVITKLRQMYKDLNANHRPLKELAGDVHEMENACLEIGADPL
jgi:hypothetical protein